MSRATINGIDTYYEEHGEPGETPVLFIHGGYGGPATTLLPTPQAVTSFLTAGVRLITYDRRSAYRSQYVLERYTLDDITRDAAELLDHLGVRRAIVIGSSAGGPVALNFALTWPERVVALGLPNTGPALMSLEPYAAAVDDPERARRRQLRAESPGVAARLRLVRQRLEPVERAQVEGDRAVFESRREELRRPSAEENLTPERREALNRALEATSDDDLFTWSTGSLRNLEAYVGYDFTPRLGEIRVPTFIVHGKADRTVPIEYGYDLAEAIPGAEFHEIEGAGHGITSNAEAQRLLADWVARIVAGS
jgi:pimeloyl-ACP methyl ester carboxylesterase